MKKYNDITIHTPKAERVLEWFGKGWLGFSGQFGNWLLIALLFFGITLLLGFIPLIGLALAYLIIPSLQAGMLLAAEKSQRDEAIDIEDLFSILRDPNRHKPFITLGVIMLAVVLGTGLILSPLLGGDMLGTMDNMPRGDVALFPAMGAGGLFFTVVVGLAMVMLFLFAPALILYKALEPWEAMKTSFMACFQNPLPLLLFMLIYGVLAFIAAIPFGLGLLVLLPVATGAVYAAYTEIFEAH